VIRYRVTPEDRPPIVFLGLSEGNVERLRAGSPIRIKAEDDIGLGVELVIYHGATEVELTRELEDNGFLPAGATAKAQEAIANRGEYRHEAAADGEQR
jgi:hypothetical protein